MSTTGLATIAAGEAYNFWGQLVILGLIQAGGLGYMTLGSFVALSREGHLSEFRRSVSRAAFPLPRSFREEPFLRQVVIFALSVELIGALALLPSFYRAGVENPAWQAVFHSISAFCTAGFSLFPSGLEGYSNDVWVQSVIAALSLSGAIGFIVLIDIYNVVTEQKKSVTYTTRIIMWMTATLLAGGWAALFLGETSYQALPPWERLCAAGFQAMTAMTTVGFNTTPIGELSAASLIVMLALMIVGASPSGTGGGLKSTTLSALLATVRSAFSGSRHVEFRGNRIPLFRLRTAHAAATTYVIAIAASCYLLLLLEPFPFGDLLFEAVSALGTVGLSRGITGELSELGKCVVIALMFVGRLGPLTFGVALMASPEVPGESGEREVDGDLAL